MLPDEYTLRRSKRARQVRISINSQGHVLVTIPEKSPVEHAVRFVNDKKNWITQTQEKLRKKFEGKTMLKQSRGEYKKLKKEALSFIKNRIMHFNHHYNYRFGRVSIRMQKSRWGSCSRKGNLNFNYKLIHLPQELADYIIVHELCHLKEFNHSKKFWDLVAQTIPDHAELRRSLRNKYVHIS